MKKIHRIWDDIKNGENIDLYAVVATAIIFTLLGLLGLGNDRTISSINVAVLGLIAFAMLQTRRALESLQLSVSAANATNLTDEFPKDFVATIESAKEVVLTGVHHSSTMNDHYGAFKRMVENGGTLKVLQSPPDGHACSMAVLRFAGSVDENQEQIRARSSMKVISELKRVAPDRVEVKTLDYLFEYGSCLVNPNESNAIVYVQRYTFKIFGGARKPKLIYRRSDGQWFNLYHSEILSFWSIGNHVIEPGNQQ